MPWVSSSDTQLLSTWTLAGPASQTSRFPGAMKGASGFVTGSSSQSSSAFPHKICSSAIASTSSAGIQDAVYEQKPSSSRSTGRPTKPSQSLSTWDVRSPAPSTSQTSSSMPGLAWWPGPGPSSQSLAGSVSRIVSDEQKPSMSWSQPRETQSTSPWRTISSVHAGTVDDSPSAPSMVMSSLVARTSRPLLTPRSEP